MRVLAIDPGYERLGIAVMEGKSGDEKLLYSACVITDAKLQSAERLLFLGKEVRTILDNYSPDCLAIETLFLTNNHKTAMLVAAARGVILFLAAERGLQIFEYSPLQIKNAVTGYGKSDKKQVISMVERLITISKKIKHDDEYDAIAIGLTCIASEKMT